MEFKVGDRIVARDPLYANQPEHAQVAGVVVRIEPAPLNFQYLYIQRDDGFDVGLHEGREWLCRSAWATLELPPIEIQPVQSGYHPDGFNPDAHRAFLKTLGG